MRFAVLFSVFGLLYSSLIFNIYSLQVKKGMYYSARAESQNRLAGTLDAKRGGIFFTDRAGNKIPAAIQKEYSLIYAVPKEITDAASVAAQLALITGLDREKLKVQLSKPGDPYELIMKKTPPEKAEAILLAKLEGIHIGKDSFRFYPFSTLAAQVIGFLAPDAGDPVPSGKYGIELKFDSVLAGVDGQPGGDRLAEPESGRNVMLTIDSNIQSKAEDVLVSLVKKYDATGGTVIVQDPQTGKILAMGNYPSFDPNKYSENAVLSSFLNPALQSVYEPGSVFKVVTMAAGLDSHAITPDTSFVDAGSVTLDGHTIRNWDLKAHGKVTMTNVIEQSINTGTVFAEQRIGKDVFYKYLDAFGFNQPTGIELPGERAGNLKNLKSNPKDINYATASFGQGIAVTPLQLAGAVSAIANGGTLYKPFIIDGTDSHAIRRVISESAAAQVKAMMVSAVKKAAVAQIPNYLIGGKTGTAQIPDFQHGGYLEEYVHSYVGFAPASNPKFTIFIKVDRPHAPLAGATVVPAFRELAEYILNYYSIPPDNLDAASQAVPRANVSATRGGKR